MKELKRITLSFLSLALIASVCLPTLSFADVQTENVPVDEANADSTFSEDRAASKEDNTTPPDNGDSVDDSSVGSARAITPATNCTATIKYYENVTYEEPGIPPNETGRYLLGTRTITGLTKGDVLNAWDYVVDIEGYYFFDGWPFQLTVSTDSDQNVIELFYGRLWNNSYTVNYYLMEGADLTADNWADALAPEDVKFIKFGSETFDNQPFGALVEGDAYEYKINGVYAVDAYPPQIRVGSDAEDDVINILYVPGSSKLPDDIEVPETTTPPSDSESEGSGSDAIENNPSDTQAPSTSTPSNPTLPSDQTFSKDELAAMLPDPMTDQEASELFEDFINAKDSANAVQISDEMFDHPVDPQIAKSLMAAYGTGFERGSASQNTLASTFADHTLCILALSVMTILTLLFLGLYLRERNLARKAASDHTA